MLTSNIQLSIVEVCNMKVIAGHELVWKDSQALLQCSGSQNGSSVLLRLRS